LETDKVNIDKMMKRVIVHLETKEERQDDMIISKTLLQEMGEKNPIILHSYKGWRKDSQESKTIGEDTHSQV
jgi:hypothetical protein